MRQRPGPGVTAIHIQDLNTVREVLSVGAVGTFAVGWLLPRLRDFQARHPFVELRLFTHNNRIDLAAEGLDCAIRFGDGQWPGMQTRHLLAAPLAPVCAPSLANRIRAVADLGRETLLRSSRSDEWLQWFDAAGGRAPAEFMSTHPSHDTRIRDLNNELRNAMPLYEQARAAGDERAVRKLEQSIESTRALLEAAQRIAQ